MPFSSSKQRGWMFEHKPKLAEEFASKTSPEEEKTLPEYSPKSKDKTHAARKRALKILADSMPKEEK